MAFIIPISRTLSAAMADRVFAARNPLRIRAEGRVHLSYDWILYCLLEREFKADKRVSFQVSSVPDCSYCIFGHRYCLTH